MVTHGDVPIKFINIEILDECCYLLDIEYKHRDPEAK